VRVSQIFGLGAHVCDDRWDRVSLAGPAARGGGAQVRL